jgi:hypothetical protein
MWVALMTAIALPLVVSLLLFRVRLHGHDGSDLPHVDM